MSLNIGIVGLPNVGKSTLFKAITKKQVDCANYPFCTIEPNHGIVAVPDERLQKLAEVSKPERIIPATVEFVDIAGLVAGASKGEGLGNKFLSHIREVDAIVEVVRGFLDPNIIHVAGKIDPAADIETINYELIFADLETLGRRLQDLQSSAKSGLTPTIKKEIELIKRIKAHLDEGKPVNSMELSKDELLWVRDLHFLTQKPILYVLNVDEQGLKDGVPGDLVKEFSPIIPICAKLESEIAELPEDEIKDYLRELGLKSTGLNTLIKESFKILGLVTFLTSGPDETRAWTIKEGTKAPQAAGVIHTDFERGFIRVEVIDWKDYVAMGEVGAKERGLMRLEGKDYLMKDGDVCYFRSA